MKKGMLAIVILAVGIANLIMSGIMVAVIVPSTKNTNNLVYSVAEAIDLEMNNRELSVYDKESYVFSQTSLTLNLKKTEGETKDTYAVINGISLILNKTSSDYAEASAKIMANEIAVSDIISTTFEEYTKDEAQENKEEIKNKIVLRISEEFETKIVVDVKFASVAYQ